MRSAHKKSWFVVGAALAMGCGGSSAGDARFPSAGDIEKLGQGAPPARIARGSQVDVPSWKLKDAPAERATGAHAAANPFEQLLTEAASRRQGLLFTPEAMHCVAHQTGLFLLAQGGVPSDDLSHFIAGRCGVANGNVSTSWLTSTVTGAMSDAQLFAAQKKSVADLIASNLNRGNQLAGLWFGRDNGKVAIALAFGERQVQLDEVPMRADAKGHVKIRGEVLIPTERLQALSNHGKFGYRRCAMDPSEKLPRFSLDCEVNPADPSTVIEVGAFPPGRITGRIVADLLVFPSGTVIDQYDRAAGGHLNDAVGGAETADSLVRGAEPNSRRRGTREGDASGRRERHGGKGGTPFLCSVGGSCPRNGGRSGDSWAYVPDGRCLASSPTVNLRRVSHAIWLILGRFCRRR